MNLDFSLLSLRSLSVCKLIETAEKLNVADISKMNKPELVYSIAMHRLSSERSVRGGGVLDILSANMGYLRSKCSNYLSGKDDVFVPQKFIAKYELKAGHTVEGEVGLADGKKLCLKSVDTIDGVKTSDRKRRVNFDALTAVSPLRKIQLEIEGSKERFASGLRMLDLLTPIGFGQRALIIAPPKSGKTILTRGIAKAIEKNHPEAVLIVLLVDERPEEVTSFTRAVDGGNTQVVSSNFDELPENHVKVAEMALNMSKRLAESGKDVVILLDSMTRLARAYNVVTPSSGRVLSGGLDANAMQKPKRFFGAARNFENAGSITIIATALTGTDSKMDEVIRNEFTGTGNCDIILDEAAARAQQFPALNIFNSSTREDYLLGGFNKNCAESIIKHMKNKPLIEALHLLTKKLGVVPTNREFVRIIENSRS